MSFPLILNFDRTRDSLLEDIAVSLQEACETRLFAALFHEMGLDHEPLLFHTEVKWLPWDKAWRFESSWQIVVSLSLTIWLTPSEFLALHIWQAFWQTELFSCSFKAQTQTFLLFPAKAAGAFFFKTLFTSYIVLHNVFLISLLIQLTSNYMQLCSQ